MTEYELTLVVDADPTERADQLFELGQGDLVPEGGNGSGVVHALIEANTLPEAIGIAVHAVETAGLAVTGLQSDDLVSLRDIAARTGRTYESVRLMAAGKRGPGGFPAPLSQGQWALYSWARVSQWLAEAYGTTQPSEFERQVAAADHLLRARQMLSGEQRAKMAELVYA